MLDEIVCSGIYQNLPNFWNKYNKMNHGKKQFRLPLFKKYGKSRSTSLTNFIKHKLLFSEE